MIIKAYQAPDAFRPLDIKLSDDSNMKIYFVRMDLKVKGLSGKRRVIIETHRIGDWTNAEVSYFISNATDLRDVTVIRYYHRRNWIEVFYREVKDFLDADEYQVRSLEKKSKNS